VLGAQLGDGTIVMNSRNYVGAAPRRVHRALSFSTDLGAIRRAGGAVVQTPPLKHIPFVVLHIKYTKRCPYDFNLKFTGLAHNLGQL
jgi:hypothetical protein